MTQNIRTSSQNPASTSGNTRLKSGHEKNVLLHVLPARAGDDDRPRPPITTTVESAAIAAPRRERRCRAVARIARRLLEDGGVSGLAHRTAG